MKGTAGQRANRLANRELALLFRIAKQRAQEEKNMTHPHNVLRTPIDMVNHPMHYMGDNSMEVIDVIENFHLPYNLGNVTKYVLRAGNKTNKREDLEKARWYLNREIDGCEHAFKEDEKEADPTVEPSKFAQSLKSDEESVVGPNLTATDIAARREGLVHIPGHGFHVDSKH